MAGKVFLEAAVQLVDGLSSLIGEQIVTGFLVSQNILSLFLPGSCLYFHVCLAADFQALSALPLLFSFLCPWCLICRGFAEWRRGPAFADRTLCVEGKTIRAF